MIAAMPEARKHKSELYVALCIKDFANLGFSYEYSKTLI